jgi:hypothetical protein
VLRYTDVNICERLIMKLKDNKKSKKIEEKIKYEPDLLEYIQPQGGIKFSIDYARTGTGYETCIQIYQFPTYIYSHWLSDICYFEGAITTIDIHTENEEDALQNISKSMKEYRGRSGSEKNDTGVSDAVNAYSDLSRLYESVKRMSRTLKSVIVRIYFSAKTKAELEKRQAEILNKLDEYKGSIMLNEQKYEYQAMFLPYKKQQELPNARLGIPILDEAIAAGDPFHFASLSDPNGLYLGSTSCGGSVMFNPFFKSSVRTYYNTLILGNMGSGKSTLLKKLSYHSFLLGDYVRLFDVVGELRYMADVCGWTTINLDGTDGIYNMFQILKVDEDEGICWSRHTAKLALIYEILSQEHNPQEIISFNKCVKNMYNRIGILPDEIKYDDKITGYSPEEYPTMSDFISHIELEMEEIIRKKPDTKAEEKLLVDEVVRLSNIKRVFVDVRDNYGKMLDGHTSIDNIMDTQGVVFNIKNIASLPAHIANTILYETLSMCWDNCTRNGLIMKQLYEEGKIGIDEVVHFLITFDEAHKIMNTRFPVALQQLTDMQREMRKVFGGLCLATQSISECIPEGSSEDSVRLIKDLFSFSNYKFIGKQDESLKQTLKNAFGSALNDNEYNRIPVLGQGNFILSIQGDRNIEFKVYASDDELNMFRGGA